MKRSSRFWAVYVSPELQKPVPATHSLSGLIRGMDTPPPADPLLLPHLTGLTLGRTRSTLVRYAPAYVQ